jgi:periplasmic protein TonB
VARRKKKGLSKIYAVSLAVHLVIGGVLVLIPQQQLRAVVAIALSEAQPKKEKKAAPPKPPERRTEPPPRPAARSARPVAAAPTPSAESATQAPTFTDLGLMLDSSASGGLAVNIAPQPKTVAHAPVAAFVKPKIIAARIREEACSEAVIKARPLELARPAYTDAARRARVQGRVRIQLAVNDRGDVIDARVVEGLGFGLDEAALAAARRLRFSPAMQCKRPVAAPFVIAMRFVLGT